MQWKIIGGRVVEGLRVPIEGVRVVLFVLGDDGGEVIKVDGVDVDAEKG